MFKKYDIRGIYPDDINEQKAYDIARAYVELMREENPGEKLKFVVGRDMRLSSPKLMENVIEGITDSGADVVDIGLASTPTFYYAVGKGGYNGGLQVSASHNPKEYNGIKAVRAKGYPIGLDNGLDKIKEITEKKDFGECDRKGEVEKGDFLQDEVDYSLNYYKFETPRLKVVADVANAMSSIDLDALFRNLPCDLVRMNFELDGTFPAHQADPFQEKNIKDIKERVKEENADLGIATDGDGDRIFFIDENGDFVEPAIIRGLIAKRVLKNNPGATICYDIRPGRITRDMIEEYGGKPSVTKVGHSLIKKQAIEEGAPFAGESSGHFFLKTDYGTFEMPMIVALIIMDELTRPFSEVIRPLRKYYHSGEINMEVDDKEGKMKLLEQKFGEEAKSVSWLDGVTIEYEDFWFNVRPSNTESKLRLNLEARSGEKMEEMRDKIESLLRS